MKFNPITQKLYSNDMTFIKKLSCPYNISWDMLPISENNQKRFCSLCRDYVYDINGLSDLEILEMVKKKQETCLKLSYNQENIKIGLYDG